jgi:GMP synthase-like glutamine amidotransferase
MSEPGLVLQHDDDVPPALLGEWLDRRGIEWRHVHVEREGLPERGDAPWVAVLGSRHSVTQSEPAWIPAELELLRGAIGEGVPVLGICFGSQALASAMGATVGPSPFLEAAWDDTVEIVEAEIPPGPWLNFHTESFTLPAGARLLAYSAAGPSAFRRGPHLGVQFHPEATPEIANGWALRHQLAGRPVDAAAIAADGEAYREDAVRRAFSLFDGWWRRLRR